MNLLATGAWNDAKENTERLEAMGHSVVFMQQEKDAIPCQYDWIEGVVCNGLFLHHSIDKFKNLRYVQLTSAGYDKVSMDYIQKHSIEIYNARGVYSIPMAEFAIAGILLLYKQLLFFNDNQRKHNWEKHRGLLELYCKTVCIVGCGNVGTECAKRLKAFGCRIIGVDVFPYESCYYEKIEGIDALDTCLMQSDVVILTLPLNEQTKGLINEQRFANMKRGSILVNISRGAVVASDALVDALKFNLGGAVLDVFNMEPLSENSLLWDLENVIITPHNSFMGEKNGERLTSLIIENLKGAV